MWQHKHLIGALPGSLVNAIICTCCRKACDERMSVVPENIVIVELRLLGVYLQFKFGAVRSLPERHADAEHATFLLLRVAWTCCHRICKRFL